MNFAFEKPEPAILAGPNFSVLEYLIERFNRPELEGTIFLRRSAMLRDLQLCLVGECCGTPVTILSESFDDSFITDAAQKERFVATISRFLLRVKQQHRKNCPAD